MMEDNATAGEQRDFASGWGGAEVPLINNRPTAHEERPACSSDS